MNTEWNINIPRPTMAPFAQPIDKATVQGVWDTYVAPGQADGEGPQSIEMRALMGILRAVHRGLEIDEADRG